MAKKLFYLVVVLVLLVGGYFGYSFWFGKSSSGLPPLDFTEVRRGDLTQTIDVNGNISPVTLVTIGAQVSGIVKDLRVDFNQKVKKGEVMLVLDDVPLRAQVTQSQANLQSAQAERDLAKADNERYQALYEKKFVTKQELDQAVQKYSSAKARLTLVQAQLLKDQQNLTYATITSPIDGIVIDRQVDIGQTVASSFQAPVLFKVAQNLNKMQLLASVSEANLGMLKVGQIANFTVDAFGARPYRGVVQQIRLNPNTQSSVVNYSVVILVDNDDLSLLPGMTANISIAVGEAKDALLVPNAALRFKPKDNLLAFVDRTAATSKTSAPLTDQAGTDQAVAATAPASALDGSNDASTVRAAKPAEAKTQGKTNPAKAANDKTPNKVANNPSANFREQGTVYKVVNNKLVPVKVSLGITDLRSTEIFSDQLQEGDQIVNGELSAEAKPSNLRFRPF